MTRAPLPALAPALEWAVALLLALQAATALAARFENEPGLDFYHFWGIGAARALAVEPLGNPYRDAARHAEVLNRHADASRDRHLQRANALRRDPTPGATQLFDPTSTPLAYAVFAALPLDYSRAHAIFRALSLAAALAGSAGILLALGISRPRAWLAAAALPLAYRPIAIDWNVGNVGAFQLAFTALLLRAAARLPKSAPATALTRGEHAYLAGLVAFALFKPNTAPIALAFAWGFVRQRGSRVVPRAAATAFAAGLAIAAATSLWLGSASSWLDWWSYLRGPAGEKLAGYAIGSGNQSLVALLAPITGIGSALQSLLHAALALASLAIALRGRPLDALAEPVAAASVGTLLLFLSAPLIWNHYAVLLLVPGAWLVVRGSPRPRALAALALFAFALIAGPAEALLGIAGLVREPLRTWLVALAPVALWFSALAALRRGARAAR
jgi:hypothetical protein